MTVPSVLAVFAHPDDESLSAGGLIARTASLGGRAAVVTPTWGAESRRAIELAEALLTLGADPPRLLGYADAHVPESAMDRPRLCDAPLEEVVAKLVEHIRDFRPDTIVTHDAYGGVTGHRDHRRTHRATVVAARAAAANGLHPEAGPPWAARHLYLATHPHSALPTLVTAIGPGRARYSVPDEQVTLTIDVTPWLDKKIDAILCHRSEVQRGALPGLIAAMAPDVRTKLLGTEWYSRWELDVDR
ncbi:PIG-L deacetylase family protein [Nocardioides sp. SYSU D00065]|uniref:PIG-L deacetylase family protein n=1 Tax=Nocardioides sp. SYSU D00065 TaxID=2817378 RepID=UPI001B32DA62|nr:PIG-L deacetylase family protein [Nocardioides sp. SYSU D00065]